MDKLNCSRTNFIQHPAPQFETTLMTMNALDILFKAFGVIIFISFFIIVFYANQSLASAYWAFFSIALQIMLLCNSHSFSFLTFLFIEVMQNPIQIGIYLVVVLIFHCGEKS